MDKIIGALIALFSKQNNLNYREYHGTSVLTIHMPHPDNRHYTCNDVMVYNPYGNVILKIENGSDFISEMTIDTRPISNNLDELLFSARLLYGDDCTYYVAHKIFQKLVRENVLEFPKMELFSIESVKYYNIIKGIIQNG